MIIKSLSRKSGGAGGLLRYVLRYSLRENEKHDTEKKPLKVLGETSKRTLAHAKVVFLTKAERERQASLGYERNADKYVKQYFLSKLEKGRQELDGGSVEKQASFLFRHNVTSRTIDGMVAEFKRNEERRIHKRSDQPSLHHVIISFHPDDTGKIDDKALYAMVREYTRLRGDDILVVGAKHTDRSHLHCHLVVSPSRTNGMSARVSIRDFERIRSDLEKFQEKHFPQLRASVVDYEKRERGGGGKNIKTHDEGIREQLGTYIQEAKGMGLTKDTATWYLAERGFMAYFRGGEVQGVIHQDNGRRFQFKEPEPVYGKQPEAQEQQIEELRRIRLPQREREVQRKPEQVVKSPQELEEPKVLQQQTPEPPPQVTVEERLQELTAFRERMKAKVNERSK